MKPGEVGRNQPKLEKHLSKNWYKRVRTHLFRKNEVTNMEDDIPVVYKITMVRMSWTDELAKVRV